MPPTCPSCSRPLPRATARVAAPCEPGSARPIAGWSYHGNMAVVSRDYWHPDDPAGGPRRLRSVGVWDGASYATAYAHFCSTCCAARYGQRMRDLMIRTSLAA